MFISQFVQTFIRHYPSQINRKGLKLLMPRLANFKESVANVRRNHAACCCRFWGISAASVLAGENQPVSVSKHAPVCERQRGGILLRVGHNGRPGSKRELADTLPRMTEGVRDTAACNHPSRLAGHVLVECVCKTMRPLDWPDYFLNFFNGRIFVGRRTGAVGTPLALYDDRTSGLKRGHGIVESSAGGNLLIFAQHGAKFLHPFNGGF